MPLPARPSACLSPVLALLAALLPGIAGANSAPDLPRFDILEFRIEGNSRLAPIDIEAAVLPHLGEGRTLLDVEAARGALEKAYHGAGYMTVLVSIPEQKVDEGVVTLAVVEGEVGRLRIKGADFHLPSEIRERVPELAVGRVPHFPSMQQELAGLNRNPDLKATPVLRAGRYPGQVDVHLEVEDQLPLHGSIDFNNRQSPGTTNQRLTGALRYDNLWQARHSLSLTFQTSPRDPGEVRVAAANYVAPLGGGDALAAYVVRSRSDFATLPGSPGLGMLGNTNILGLRYALALPAGEHHSQSLSLGADYKSVKQSLRVGGAAGIDTPISYAPLAASYTGTWLAEGRTLGLEAGLVLGLRGLFGNRDAEFDAKRAGATASFAAFRGAIHHTESLGRWGLHGRLDWQLASGPLVSNEQMAAGGAESVRGYLESERMGDEGLRLALELRTPGSSLGEASPWRLRGLLFWEGARLRTRQALFPQPPTYLLRGAGVGLRLSGPRGTDLELDLARAVDEGDLTRAGDWRLHARLLWEF